MIIAIVVVASSIVIVHSATGASSAGTTVTATSPANMGGNVKAPVRGLLDAGPVTPAYMDKVTTGLKDLLLADPKEQIQVVVYTTEPTALGQSLRASGVQTDIGSVPSTWIGIRPLIMEVPAFVIPKIAYLESVQAISGYTAPDPPQSPDPEVTAKSEPDSSGPGDPVPRTIFATQGHHATEAWAAGYTGDGVNVAILDAGVDFANPDLLDTWAVDENASSPYFQWPIAFDPNSMYSYLLADRTYPASSGSWYADTSFNATKDSNDTLPTFSGRNYNVSNIPSASGWYHMGLNPARTLRSRFGHAPGVLLVDSVTPYVYDTIYVDLNDNGRFDDDKPTDVLSPISYADYRDATTGLYNATSGWDWGDGLPDLSGGLVYFIADGIRPVPYSDVVADRYGLNAAIPGNGNVTAFMIGDANVAGGDHGTMCASAVAAQNRTGYVLGFAPDAKIIAVGDIYAGGFFTDVYNFAAEGYDGVPGTGGEAMIASSSYGSSNVDNDGWDYESRYVQMLTTFYRTTAFLASTGNGGYGFGTVNSPGGSVGEISVGASTSYYNGPKTSWEPGTTWNFGDVQPWSDRGPSALGNIAPDIVTVGAWASGDNAVNQRTVGATNGSNAWSVWGGTSLACPATAGILAVIFDAYNQGHSAFPTADVARQLLMNGADDIHYDPLVAGSGLTNTFRSALMAAKQSGVTVYPPAWTPGDYRGTSYPGFANIIVQGGTSTNTFQLVNTDPVLSVTTNIADGFMKKTGDWAVDFWSNNSDESPASSNSPDHLWNVSAIMPLGTQLVRAIVYTNYTSFDPSFQYNPESYYRALFYNWKDLNSNGVYWTDLDSNGVVNAGELDPNEYMRFTYAYNVADVQNAFVHDPASRVADGLLFGVIHRVRSANVPSTLVHAVLEFYSAADEPWITVNPPIVNIAANGGTASFTATVSVPANAAVGTYSAFITLTTGGSVTVVPVVINVAGSSESISLQEDVSNTHYYDNGKIYGGQDWAWRAESGDWRFYYTDIPDATTITNGTKFIVHTMWQNYPTDIDTLVLGPTSDPFSDALLSTYGPYSLSTVGASPNMNVGAGYWLFNTATGGPEEWVSAPAANGLHEILLHNVLYAGGGPSETFNGTTGFVTVNPFPWTEQVSRNTGTKTFDFVSTMELASGMAVTAYGVSKPVTYTSPITQGELVSFWKNATNAGTMDVILTCGFSVDLDLYVYYEDPVYGETLVGSSTTPTANERVKLTLPANGEYRFEIDGYSVPMPGVTFDLTVDIREGNNLTPMNVPVGPIMPGVHYAFDIDYTLPDIEDDYYGVIFIGPASAPTAIEMPVLLMARDTTPPVITLQSPTPGSMYRTATVPIIHATFDDVRGAFYTGVNMDSVKIEVDGRDVTSSARILPGGNLWWNLTFLLGEGTHDVTIRMTDRANPPNPASLSFSFTVDNTAPTIVLTAPTYSITNNVVISVRGYTEANIAVVFVNGVPVSATSGAFSTTVTLSVGINTITIEATDTVGNIGTLFKTVELDTTPPALTVVSPTPGLVLNQRSVEVNGTTDRDATLTVNGLDVTVDISGSFSVRIPLSEGPNSIKVVATDPAGNQAVTVVGVSVDTVPPALTITRPGGPYSNNRVVGVAGQTEVGASVTINGGPADNIASDGSFVGNATLGEGVQTITVKAADGAGNIATVVKSITVDTAAPIVTILSPGSGQTLTTPTLLVSGTVNEPSATLSIQGLVVAVTPTGGWSTYVQLLVGPNTITVVATDPAGNAGTASITETYTPPDLITPLQENITSLRNQILNLQSTLTNLSSKLNDLTTQFKNLNTSLNNANINVTNLQNGLNGAQNDIKGIKSDISGLSNVVLMGMALLIVLLLVGLLGMYMALSRKMNALHGVTKEEAEEELEEEEEEEAEQEEEDVDEDEEDENK